MPFPAILALAARAGVFAARAVGVAAVGIGKPISMAAMHQSGYIRPSDYRGALSLGRNLPFMKGSIQDVSGESKTVTGAGGYISGESGAKTISLKSISGLVFPDAEGNAVEDLATMYSGNMMRGSIRFDIDDIGQAIETSSVGIEDLMGW